MFGPTLGKSPNTIRKPGIWDEMDPDITSTPMRLKGKSALPQTRKNLHQREEKSKDRSTKDEKKKLSFNIFGTGMSKAETSASKREEKKASHIATKLEDADKKIRADSTVNIKEKNFWSKQFSKYCGELENLIGQTPEPGGRRPTQDEQRQCFDALLHGIDGKSLARLPAAVVLERVAVLAWTDRRPGDCAAHIRVFALDLMGRPLSDGRPRAPTSPSARQESPKNSNNEAKPDEVERGNRTPGNDLQFLGFFNAQAILSSTKAAAAKAVVASVSLPNAIICGFEVSASQRLLGVVLADEAKSEISVTIFELPSLSVLLASEPLAVSSPFIGSYSPFFSYSNSYGSDMDPGSFVVPFKDTTYCLELGREPGEKSIQKDLPVRLRSDPSMIEDLGKTIGFAKLHNRDFMLGKLTETKTQVEYGIWRWNKHRGRGYEKRHGLKLEISSKYTLQLDSMTPDGRFMFGYHKGGKEVVRVSMRTSAVKAIFKYSMESKTITSSLVVDGGSYLILADSANEVRVYRKFQKNYQSIYCQYMVEPIEDLKLSHGLKILLVLTSKRLISIRVHLGQTSQWEFFGKRQNLSSINGIYVSKNKRIVRFVDQNFDRYTTYIDDLHGFRSEEVETGRSSGSKHVLQIPQSDQTLIWDSLTIKVVSPPIQSCTNMNGGLFRNQYPTITHDQCHDLDLYLVRDPEITIKKVTLNLGNDYIFIYLGDSTSMIPKTIEVLSIQNKKSLFNITEIEFEYCICREADLILRWKSHDLTSMEHGYYSNGEFSFEPISVDKRKKISLIDVKTVHELGNITKVIFITDCKLFIFDVCTMVILCRSFPINLEDIKTEVSPDGRFIAINERSYRSLLVYGIELNESGDFENCFQVSGNFVETLRFVFSHDSEFLVSLDEEFIIKIISLRLKKEISQFSIKEQLADPSVDLTHMFFSELSYHLVLCFHTDKKHHTIDEGFLVLKIPFYSTRFSPIDTILGYYIQRYFYSSNLLEKSVLCKSMVNILHSYPHYQLTINSVFTITVLLINAPTLIEQYCGSFLDFNVLCMHGLLKFSMEHNKFFSLMSYNNLFASYSAKTRETPYIDEEQIDTLSRLEKSKMNNRYSRAVLSQVIFSFVRSEYGELKHENKNVVQLPLNYKPHQLEEAISKLMKQDFSTINKYHCYATQIPMDLSTGSEFSIAFFSNISNYSEEEIQTKYKIFIYYKWSKIYYFALTHSVFYWLFNILVYLYLGKYIDYLWMAVFICALNLLFIVYEVRCFLASVRHYFQDAWNQFDFINHVVNLTIVIAMITVDEDEKVFILNLFRFISTLLIGIRGISLLVVFKPTRHITTMFFQVCLQIWPFLIVLAYIIFIATQAWSIEPQIERSELPTFSFLDALNVVINTSMGNFNTNTGDGASMTNLQLILIILVNVVLGLAMLNFLIAFISEIYQKISDKRDYYEALELLPIIQQFDLLFRKRKQSEKNFRPGQVLQINEHDDPYHTLIGSQLIQTPTTEPTAVQTIDLAPTRTSSQPQYLKEFISRSTFIPSLTKKIKQAKSRNNSNRCHYLTIIPEQERSDQLRDLKTSIQTSVKEMAHDLGDQNSELAVKTDKLKYAMRDLQASYTDIKAMIQAIVGAQDALNRRLEFATQGRALSATSLPEEEEIEKTANLNTTISNVTHLLKDESEDSNSLRSDGETDQFLHGNLVNG
jgi:hypothetical protein